MSARTLAAVLLFAASLHAAPPAPAPKWYVAHVTGHPGTVRANVSVLYGPFRSPKPAEKLCAAAVNSAWSCRVEPVMPAASFPPNGGK